jgi:glycosyltransferase involved in cell wall biosynthesis
MARLLPPDRIRCSIVALNAKVSPVLAEQLPCPLHVFPLRRTYDLNSFRVAAQIRRLMRSESVDIVHTLFESANLWGGLVTKFGGGPLLVSSRRDMNILRTSLKHRLGYLLVNRLCDSVLVVSDAVRDLCIREEHLAPDKVVTLHNGIELERISASAPDLQLREQWGFGAEDPVITSVANVRRVKGIDTLVQAARIVCREFPHARFVVVGGENEADYGKELRQTIQTMGLARNVFFAGLTEQVIPILKISQIFCLMSRSEGFSSALLEAMACSLPCVVTRVGGNSEAVLDGETGFVVAPEDHAAAGDRILRLLRDPQRRAAMGAESRRVVSDKFTAGKMAADLAAFYERLALARMTR